MASILEHKILQEGKLDVNNKLTIVMRHEVNIVEHSELKHVDTSLIGFYGQKPIVLSKYHGDLTIGKVKVVDFPDIEYVLYIPGKLIILRDSTITIFMLETMSVDVNIRSNPQSLEYLGGFVDFAQLSENRYIISFDAMTFIYNSEGTVIRELPHGATRYGYVDPFVEGSHTVFTHDGSSWEFKNALSDVQFAVYSVISPDHVLMGNGSEFMYACRDGAHGVMSDTYTLTQENPEILTDNSVRVSLKDITRPLGEKPRYRKLHRVEIKGHSVVLVKEPQNLPLFDTGNAYADYCDESKATLIKDIATDIVLVKVKTPPRDQLVNFSHIYNIRPEGATEAVSELIADDLTSVKLPRVLHGLVAGFV